MSSQKSDKVSAENSAVNFPQPTDPNPLQLEKRRAGAALRRIIDGIIMKHPDAQAMAALANQLEALADGLTAMPEKISRTGFGSRMSPEDARDFVEFSPLTGRSNPIAPPVDLWIEGDRVHGQVHFSRGFEGAPGLVHGGHVAAVFDELLGFTQGLSKQPGMTGTLTIVYRAPTPLLTDLRLEGVYEGMEGRKIFTSGKLFAGETLLAEAKGLFIALTEAQHAAVLQINENMRLSSQA